LAQAGEGNCEGFLKEVILVLTFEELKGIKMAKIEGRRTLGKEMMCANTLWQQEAWQALRTKKKFL
jgi:hypothetical protein